MKYLKYFENNVNLSTQINRVPRKIYYTIDGWDGFSEILKEIFG